jgi:hypothetical protein
MDLVPAERFMWCRLGMARLSFVSKALRDSRGTPLLLVQEDKKDTNQRHSYKTVGN